MSIEDKFEYKGWKLFDALDALWADDSGADSGVKDELMKVKVKSFFGELSEHDFRIVTAHFARRYLTDERLAVGYGLEDVLSFIGFLRDGLGLYDI